MRNCFYHFVVTPVFFTFTALPVLSQTSSSLAHWGQNLYRQGRISESIAVLQQAQKQDPRNPAISALLARDYCAINEDGNARIYLDRIHQDESARASMASLAPCYLQAGEASDALLAYGQLRHVVSEPSDEVLVGLARALMKISKEALGRLETLSGNETYLLAVKAARSGEAATPDGALPLAYRHAPYLTSDGTTIDSVVRLVSFRTVHAKDPAFEYILGVRAGEVAIQTVAECQNRFPRSVALLRLEAEILASQGQLQEATERLKGAAAATPASPELFRDLGLTYYRMKDFVGALAEFRKLLDKQPNSEEAKVAVSRCLLQLGQYRDDAELLKPLVTLPHPPEWVLLDWAIVQENLKQPVLAIRALKQIEVLRPGDASIHYRLGRLYASVGDGANSQREFELFKRFPKESDVVNAAKHGQSPQR